VPVLREMDVLEAASGTGPLSQVDARATQDSAT